MAPGEAAYPKSGDISQEGVRRRALDSSRLVARGILLNVTLAAIKFAGGIFGNTYALIADGYESLLDVVTSVVVFTGLRLAARPPDDNHPYGHGKAEAIAGLVVSLVMCGVAVLVGWQAMAEIRTPHQGPHWGTLPLLAGIVVSKYFFSRRMGKASVEAGSTSLGIEAWHHFADALTSAAAFIGIAIAVWGGEGYETADDWSAIVAAVVIAWNGVSLAKKAVDDMMDIAVPATVEKQMRDLASSVPGVRGIDKCRVRRSGLSYLIDIHVEVDGSLTVTQGHDIAGAVKHTLLLSPLQVTDVLVHIEPSR